MRADFLRVAASGIRFVAPAFIVQMAKSESATARYGLTATKKLGNAVVRNRARRRLRSLAQKWIIGLAAVNDYVLVAREPIIQRDYAQLEADMEKALRVLKCLKG